MSTRAVITIKDDTDEFHIYQHCDGYPEGVLPNLHEALKYAWSLPRFEAMDFAAAYIRATKEHGGNIYCTKHWNHHGDLSYRYEVYWSVTSKQPKVDIYEAKYGKNYDDPLTFKRKVRGVQFVKMEECAHEH